MTLSASRNAISSPELEAGPMPPGLPDGLMTDLFGQALAPVSRSRSREKAAVLTTQGICGPTSFASSESADRPLFGASRSAPQPGKEPASMRKCLKCGVEKTCSDFYKTKGKHASSSGYHAQCKTCCKTRQADYRTGSKTQRSESFKKYRITHRASILVAAARTRAKAAGLAFDLDNWLPELTARVDAGRCELSGMAFRLDGGRTWDSPSLDRIEPKLGYTITNVRVVLFSLNVMMNTWGVEPVLAIAAAIKAQRETDDQHPLAQWEKNLKARLSKIGSTECALIWTQSVTPSGASMSRLAPWTPPISDRASGGAPWPTPLTRDHHAQGSGHNPKAHSTGCSTVMKMTGLMQAGAHWPTPKASNAGPDFAKIERSKTGLSLQTVMASTWVTPSARDWKDSAGMATTGPDGRNRLDQLPRQMAATWRTPMACDHKNMDYSAQEYLSKQMAATAPSGPTPNGSPATTAKRGAPNAAHPCWLMGYPVEWLHGAASATQSSRKSRRK